MTRFEPSRDWSRWVRCLFWSSIVLSWETYWSAFLVLDLHSCRGVSFRNAWLPLPLQVSRTDRICPWGCHQSALFDSFWSGRPKLFASNGWLLPWRDSMKFQSLNVWDVSVCSLKQRVKAYSVGEFMIYRKNLTLYSKKICLGRLDSRGSSHF